MGVDDAELTRIARNLIKWSKTKEGIARIKRDLKDK
jgi:hypothetical protein